MPRTRVSTTVDTDLLDQVRKQMPGAKDHALLDTALAALLAANSAERGLSWVCRIAMDSSV